jgi:hypothetical protein
MNDFESRMTGDPLKMFHDLNSNKIHFEPMVDDESYGNEANNIQVEITRWYEGMISCNDELARIFMKSGCTKNLTIS